MVNHLCSKCGEIFSKKSTFNYHITPFSVKSGSPKTPKKRNRTHKSVIILDPINYQLLIICLFNFISVGLLSFIKLKDLLYLKGLSLNFM